MDCLKDILCGNRTIIGVRDYIDCTQPESGLWLNDLPGISLKIASKVANEEVHTGAELLKACINRAIKKVFDDFDSEITPYFNFNAIVETREINDYRNASILPSTSSSRGLILKRWRSELALIYIEELYIKANTTTTKEILIYDGEDLVLTIKDVDFVAGQIKTVRVDRKFKSESVKIVMDNSDVEVYSTSIYNYSYPSCDSCDSGRGLIVKGWTGSEEDSLMYGIGVKASARCYNDNILCAILPKLYYAIWYASGAEFMKEKIYSDRLNSVTVFTKEKAKELLEEYEMEYEKKYANTVKNIQAYLRSMKGECITCNTNTYAQIHP